MVEQKALHSLESMLEGMTHGGGGGSNSICKTLITLSDPHHVINILHVKLSKNPSPLD